MSSSSRRGGSLPTAALFSASLALAGVATWRILLWRARTRLRLTVERVQALLPQDGPLIDLDPGTVMERILHKAIKRASKWMTLREELTTPMVGQVGGRSLHKKPLLMLRSNHGQNPKNSVEEYEYVLKPLSTDHRGIREIAFYEAIETVLQSSSSISQAYSHFLSGTDGPGSSQTKKRRNVLEYGKTVLEVIDTLALAMAMMLRDPVVKLSEEKLRDAWKAVKREAETIHRLSKFVPRYHGVVHTSSAATNSMTHKSKPSTNNSSSTLITQRLTKLSVPPRLSLITGSSYGVTDDAYLLLQSLTRTYARPCVMDLKMGTETYEPDCTDEKRRRESSKYVKQEEYGFRIIGMRVHDPYHDDSDDKGFRLFDKEYGRSLLERNEVVDAFRLFFSSGLKRSALSASSSSATNHEKQHHASIMADGAECERVRIRAMSNVVLQLRSLRRWFEENQCLQFRASSLLLIYEGDPSRGNGDVTMVRMIDFGHVRRMAGGDSGYLTGIQTLIGLLTEILTDEDELAKKHGSFNDGSANSRHNNRMNSHSLADIGKKRTFV